MRKFLQFLLSNAVAVVLVPCLVPFFLYVANFDETLPGSFFRAALVSILLFILFLAILSFLFRNPRRLLLFSTIAFLLLYTYGAVYDALVGAGSFLGHHKFLALVYLAGLVGLGFLVGRIKLSKTIPLAIQVACVLFAGFQLIQLVPRIQKTSQLARSTTSSQPATQTSFTRDVRPVSVSLEKGTPDVYYIILDTYARNDEIQKYFDYDNSTFTDALTQMGFYVARCSRSNYMVTRSSLASSLNLIYLQNASPEFTPRNTDNNPLKWMIEDPTVIEQFKSLGYETISLESGFNVTEFVNVDRYLQPAKPIAFLGSIQPYEILLFKYSIFKVLYDTHIPLLDPIFNKITFPYYDHVRLESFVLDRLVDISKDPKTTFTFAHIGIPHTPFIFRADGSYTTDRRYFAGQFESPVSNELFVDGYVNQVEYVNRKILEVVRQIIANSSMPPVIILQGDHGAILNDRLPILNAYYFPGGKDAGFYAWISPVNSFRLLFDNYFNGSYPLLKDESYFSTYEFLYDWSPVQESSPACLNP